MLVFLDLETTGLDATRHNVLEIAAVITDDALVEVARYSAVVLWENARWMTHPLPTVRDDWAKICNVDSFVLEMHTKSGLWHACHYGQELRDVELNLASFIRKHCSETGEKTGPQLAGNTISFDRAFLREHLPAVHALLHYRNVDVSTLNEVARRFWPLVHACRPKAGSAHRAEADCVESLETARYYVRSLGPVNSLVTAGGAALLGDA